MYRKMKLVEISPLAGRLREVADMIENALSDAKKGGLDEVFMHFDTADGHSQWLWDLANGLGADFREQSRAKKDKRKCRAEIEMGKYAARQAKKKKPAATGRE